MAALTETYVDPSIAGNSGTGTIGDPYGDIQYALNTMTRDATNGDKLNIKAGTDEILSSALSLTTYGTPEQTSPLWFRGYTSAANDGGIGGISGNGSVGVFGGDALDYIGFRDMHLHNTGSTDILSLDDAIWLLSCELDNTTANGADLDLDCNVFDCYFHNIGTAGLTAGGIIQGNYFENGTNKFTVAISLQSDCVAASNIINLSGSANASNGIEFGDLGHMIGNSIWSNAGTGHGILPGGTNRDRLIITNNIVEGFSGASGVGIEISTDDSVVIYGANAAYNNATNYDESGDIWSSYGDNETLGASPFTDPSTGDFTVDTSVKGTGIPTSFNGASTTNALDKGAAQRVEPAGGSGGGLKLAGTGGLAG